MDTSINTPIAMGQWTLTKRDEKIVRVKDYGFWWNCNNLVILEVTYITYHCLSKHELNKDRNNKHQSD